MAAEAGRLKDDEDLLGELVARCYADPELFVHTMYPWGEPGTFLANETGPDEWQTAALRALGEEVREQENLEELMRRAIRFAVASGHGVGKTAFVAWIIQWFISTRPFPQIVVTANTRTQLTTKTWRELAKWHSVSLNSHWFEWSATQFKLVARPDLWFATAVPWSVSNAQAFAGTHEAHVLMVFDEASNIEDIIWETAEGAMTTPGSMWLCLGNPVKNTGRFRECWTRFRDRWTTFQVDARKAKKANQIEIRQWIEDYGLESDFVKTRILGEFPSSSPLQMIPVDLVDEAVAREVKWENIPVTTPKLMGVDVARSGSAQSVILFRQGPKLLKDIYAYRIPDLMLLAAQVAKKINDYKPDVVFIDATGMGVGVYDRLVQLGFDNVVAIYTGDRKEVLEKRVYYNPRIESWARLKTWLRTADIPDHRPLREDLIGPEYFFDQAQLMRLESKEDMAARGIPSPDFADALALTFSQAVPVKRVYGHDDEYSNEPEVV